MVLVDIAGQVRAGGLRGYLAWLLDFQSSWREGLLDSQSSGLFSQAIWLGSSRKSRRSWNWNWCWSRNIFSCHWTLSAYKARSSARAGLYFGRPGL